VQVLGDGELSKALTIYGSILAIIQCKKLDLLLLLLPLPRAGAW
jgi:hypothetical protein